MPKLGSRELGSITTEKTFNSERPPMAFYYTDRDSLELWRDFLGLQPPAVMVFESNPSRSDISTPLLPQECTTLFHIDGNSFRATTLPGRTEDFEHGDPVVSIIEKLGAQRHSIPLHPHVNVISTKAEAADRDWALRYTSLLRGDLVRGVFPDGNEHVLDFYSAAGAKTVVDAIPAKNSQTIFMREILSAALAEQMVKSHDKFGKQVAGLRRKFVADWQGVDRNNIPGGNGSALSRAATYAFSGVTIVTQLTGGSDGSNPLKDYLDDLDRPRETISLVQDGNLNVGEEFHGEAVFAEGVVTTRNLDTDITRQNVNMVREGIVAKAGANSDVLNIPIMNVLGHENSIQLMGMAVSVYENYIDPIPFVDDTNRDVLVEAAKVLGISDQNVINEGLSGFAKWRIRQGQINGDSPQAMLFDILAMAKGDYHNVNDGTYTRIHRSDGFLHVKHGLSQKQVHSENTLGVLLKGLVKSFYASGVAEPQNTDANNPDASATEAPSSSVLPGITPTVESPQGDVTIRSMNQGETLDIVISRSTSGIETRLSAFFEQFKKDPKVHQLFQDPSSIVYSASALVLESNGAEQPYPFFEALSQNENKGFTAMVIELEHPETGILTPYYIVLNRMVDENGIVGMGITQDPRFTENNDLDKPAMIFSTGLTEAEIANLSLEDLLKRDMIFMPTQTSIPSNQVPDTLFKSASFIVPSEGSFRDNDGNVQVFENGEWVDMKPSEGIWGPVDGTSVVLVDDGEGGQDAYTQMKLEYGFVNGTDGSNLVNVAKFNTETEQWETLPDIVITRSYEDISKADSRNFLIVDCGNQGGYDCISAGVGVLGIKINDGELQMLFYSKNRVVKLNIDEVGIIDSAVQNRNPLSLIPEKLKSEDVLEMIRMIQTDKPLGRNSVFTSVLWEFVQNDASIEACKTLRGLPLSNEFNSWCVAEVSKSDREIPTIAKIEQLILKSGVSTSSLDLTKGLNDLWDISEGAGVDSSWVRLNLDHFRE